MQHELSPTDIDMIVGALCKVAFNAKRAKDAKELCYRLGVVTTIKRAWDYYTLEVA